MQKEKLTIIDLTSLFYSVSYSCQSNNLSLEEGFFLLKDRFTSILEETNANYYLSFTDKGFSFRREILSKFKNDRPANNLPYLKELKEFSLSNLQTINHSKLESDDLVILHYLYLRDKYDVIIASPDSDLRQIDGLFYNYLYRRNNSDPFIIVTKEEADLNLWNSVLAGSHNGLKGLNNCGVGTSTSLLKDKLNKETIVLDAYINGINFKRKVKGLGLIKGINEFRDNFISSYLLRNKEDCESYGIDFTYSDMIKVERDNMNYLL